MKNRLVKTIEYQFRRTWEYTQRYIHTRMKGADARKQILWELFELSNQFLADLEIEYWVNYGTLLGFYREDDIMGHDLDIDFGCHEKHFNYIMESLDRLPAELSMHDTGFKHRGPKLYMSYKGFDADIYFYREENGQLFSSEKTHWPNYNAPIPLEQTLPTQSAEVQGITTQFPAQTEAYLKTIYGNLAADAKRNPETGYWE